MKRTVVFIITAILLGGTAHAATSSPQWKIFSKLQDGLGSEPVIEATFTEADLTEILNDELKATKRNNIIEDVSVRVLDGSAEIRAKMTKFFKTTIIVRGGVEFTDGGKVLPKIYSVKFGRLSLPVGFIETIGNYLMYRDSTADWFSVPGARWEKLELKPGEVNVRVRAVAG